MQFSQRLEEIKKRSPGDCGDYSSVDVTFQGGVVAGKLQIGLE